MSDSAVVRSKFTSTAALPTVACAAALSMPCSISCLLLGASYFAMLRHLAVDPGTLLPPYAVSGFFVGAVAAIPVAMVNAFPPAVRLSGISSSYNVAYAVLGGLTSVFVSLMLKWNPPAPELYVAALCVVGALTSLALPRASGTTAK